MGNKRHGHPQLDVGSAKRNQMRIPIWEFGNRNLYIKVYRIHIKFIQFKCLTQKNGIDLA